VNVPIAYWLVVAVQALAVLVGGVTGNTLTIRFRLVKRRDDPRTFSIWLALWVASTAIEIAAGLMA
jgi:hypothetical protein